MASWETGKRRRRTDRGGEEMRGEGEGKQDGALSDGGAGKGGGEAEGRRGWLREADGGRPQERGTEDGGQYGERSQE